MSLKVIVSREILTRALESIVEITKAVGLGDEPMVLQTQVPEVLVLSNSTGERAWSDVQTKLTATVLGDGVVCTSAAVLLAIVRSMRSDELRLSMTDHVPTGGREAGREVLLIIEGDGASAYLQASPAESPSPLGPSQPLVTLPGLVLWRALVGAAHIASGATTSQDFQRIRLMGRGDEVLAEATDGLRAIQIRSQIRGVGTWEAVMPTWTATSLARLLQRSGYHPVQFSQSTVATVLRADTWPTTVTWTSPRFVAPSFADMMQHRAGADAAPRRFIVAREVLLAAVATFDIETSSTPIEVRVADQRLRVSGEVTGRHCVYAIAPCPAVGLDGCTFTIDCRVFRSALEAQPGILVVITIPDARDLPILISDPEHFVQELVMRHDAGTGARLWYPESVPIETP